MNHVPDRPNYEHADWCGEDMEPDEELTQEEETDENTSPSSN